MGEGSSLIDFGKLSDIGVALINKVSEGICGLAKPWQIRRVAKAEADAVVIKASTQSQILELDQRTSIRFMGEEKKQQENIENILRNALPQLEPNSQPQNMENDWIANFFDKSRLVSDEEMQLIWAKILAGEANSPGKYSKRTIQFLSSMDRKDAILFQKLSGFIWEIGDFSPLIYSNKAEIYRMNGVDFSSLIHLSEIGIISFDTVKGYTKITSDKKVHVAYFDHIVEIDFSNVNEKEHILNCGEVMLSKIGQDIASICIGTPVIGFFDYVIDKWKSNNSLIITIQKPGEHKMNL